MNFTEAARLFVGTWKIALSTFGAFWVGVFLWPDPYAYGALWGYLLFGAVLLWWFVGVVGGLVWVWERLRTSIKTEAAIERATSQVDA